MTLRRGPLAQQVCDGRSVSWDRAPAPRPSAQPTFQVRIRSCTGTLRVPQRTLRSGLTIPAGRETGTAFCHAAPANSHAIPCWAHAAPCWAHAVPCWAHAVPCWAHAVPANYRTVTLRGQGAPAFCLCRTCDRVWALPGTVRQPAGIVWAHAGTAWQKSRGPPVERSLAAQEQPAASPDAVIVWQQGAVVWRELGARSRSGSLLRRGSLR